MLQSSLDTARSGRSLITLMVGEPGIGKTRLVNEAGQTRVPIEAREANTSSSRRATTGPSPMVTTSRSRRRGSTGWDRSRGLLVDGNPEAPTETFHQGLRVYPLSDVDAPPEMEFISLSEQAFNTIHATTASVDATSTPGPCSSIATVDARDGAAHPVGFAIREHQHDNTGGYLDDAPNYASPSYPESRPKTSGRSSSTTPRPDRNSRPGNRSRARTTRATRSLPTLTARSLSPSDRPSPTRNPATGSRPFPARSGSPSCGSTDR